jgi:hypothetical protein
VQGAQAGDMQAFAVLVRKNQDFVYNLALRTLNRHQEAEDIAQEMRQFLHQQIVGLLADHLLAGKRLADTGSPGYAPGQPKMILVKEFEVFLIVI